MTDTQIFIIDVLKLMPQGSLCFLDTSYDTLLGSIQSMEDSNIKQNYTCSFRLTEKNVKILKSVILEKHAEEYIHNIYIEHNGEILFMSYDGLNLGEILSKIDLPKMFIKEYVQKKEMCIVRDRLPV